MGKRGAAAWSGAVQPPRRQGQLGRLQPAPGARLTARPGHRPAAGLASGLRSALGAAHSRFRLEPAALVLREEQAREKGRRAIGAGEAAGRSSLAHVVVAAQARTLAGPPAPADRAPADSPQVAAEDAIGAPVWVAGTQSIAVDACDSSPTRVSRQAAPPPRTQPLPRAQQLPCPPAPAALTCRARRTSHRRPAGPPRVKHPSRAAAAQGPPSHAGHDVEAAGVQQGAGHGVGAVQQPAQQPLHQPLCGWVKAREQKAYQRCE